METAVEINLHSANSSPFAELFTQTQRIPLTISHFYNVYSCVLEHHIISSWADSLPLLPPAPTAQHLSHLPHQVASACAMLETAKAMT